MGGRRSEGVVLLRGGNPEASVHAKEGNRSRGRAALKQVWQDSYDEACVLELHARVDMEGLMAEYADAVLERSAKIVKKTKVPQPVDRASAERQLGVWTSKGYDVSSLEAALAGDPAALTVAYLSLHEAIRKAEAVAETLASLDVKGFEARADALRQKLRDPIKHPEIDSDVESLRDAIEARKRIEARREIEAAREKDSQERTKKVLELVMKQRETLRPAAPKPSSEEVAKVLEGPPPTRDEATNLIQQYTFESFVVGASNRFAQAAAAAVAKDPHKAYNPLLVSSGPGLGKTHLLHAIGNDFRARSRDLKVLYMSSESFANEFKQARDKDALPAFRTKVRGVDCLLLDDVQFLSGKSDVQEELFHTFNDLYDSERQIVLASDRPPKAIPDLDDRLMSRFESGLVADIQPPERETRIAILERRARAPNLSVGADVIAFIADLVEDNVRELGGAFNRVVAFSSLMGQPITRDLAKEVLRGVGGETHEERRAIPEAVPEKLTPGRSYLVEEDRPSEAFRLFAKVLDGGYSGLVITRTNPKRVREKFSLEVDRILWLTDRESGSEKTIQPALERILWEIENFMSKHSKGLFLLDGLEYLISNNSFEAVLKFVRRLVDTVSEGHHVFLLSLGPATVKEQELKMLEREMEVLRAEP